MIVSCTLPHEFSKRAKRVMEARKTDRETAHLRCQLGDVLRELLGQWVIAEEERMGLEVD